MNIEEVDTNEVPYYVTDILEEVRASGSHNMFDKSGVIEEMSYYNEEAGQWMDGNRDRYREALNLMVERKNQSER